MSRYGPNSIDNAFKVVQSHKLQKMGPIICTSNIELLKVISALSPKSVRSFLLALVSNLEFKPL